MLRWKNSVACSLPLSTDAIKRSVRFKPKEAIQQTRATITLIRVSPQDKFSRTFDYIL